MSQRTLGQIYSVAISVLTDGVPEAFPICLTYEWIERSLGSGLLHKPCYAIAFSYTSDYVVRSLYGGCKELRLLFGTNSFRTSIEQMAALSAADREEYRARLHRTFASINVAFLYLHEGALSKSGLSSCMKLSLDLLHEWNNGFFANFKKNWPPPGMNITIGGPFLVSDPQLYRHCLDQQQ